MSHVILCVHYNTDFTIRLKFPNNLFFNGRENANEGKLNIHERCYALGVPLPHKLCTSRSL